MSNFPNLRLGPGTYAAEWRIGDRALPGELNVEASRPPSIEIYGEVDDVDWTGGRGFPEEHEYARLVGTLRSNEDVVLTDVRISTWFPGRSTGSARHAAVGLGISGVGEDRYAELRLQLTGADLLFGIAPIKAVSWPTEPTEHLKGTFSVEGNPQSSQHWEDQNGELTIDCSYNTQFSLGDPYRHELIFAPVVELHSSVLLTIDEWVATWITPLLRVASLATREPQRLSWLEVEAATPAASSERLHSHSRSGLVFGAGILQAPFQAEFREEWRDPERRPLFTLASLPVGLPEMLRRWRELTADENPFIELYSQALFQTDLPARARFLHLIQALESLHWHEHRAADEQAQTDFATRREAVLAELSGAELEPSAVSFLKNNWSKSLPPSLEPRLRALVKTLPKAVQDDLERPDMEPLSSELAAQDNVSTLQGKLRVLRNQLSHGTRNYAAPVLDPWVRVVETLCRAHALRLLGFDAKSIERGLATTDNPQ